MVYRAKGYCSREPALDFGSSVRSELELERAHHGIALRARCGVIYRTIRRMCATVSIVVWFMKIIAERALA